MEVIERQQRAGGVVTSRRPVLLLTVGMASIAAVLIALQVSAAGVTTPQPWLWLLLPMFVAAENTVVHMPTRGSAHSHTMREIPAIIGLAFLNTGDFLVAYMVGTAILLVLARSQRWMKMFFNLAMFALEAAVRLLVYHWVLGSADAADVRGWAAAFAAILVTDGISAVAVTAAIRISEGRLETDVLKEAVTVGLVAAMVNTCLALLCVVLIVSKPAALPLLAVVLLMLAVAYRAYISLGSGYSRLQLLYQFVDSSRAPTTLEDSIDGLLTDARELLRADSAELIVLPHGPEAGSRTTFANGLAVSRTAYDRPDGERDAWWAPAVLGESVLKPAPGTSLRRGSRAGPPLAGNVIKGSPRDGIAAPLRIDGRVDAVMLVVNRSFETETFTWKDQLLCETLAAHASVALGKARLVDRLRRVADQREHEAHHDSLTLLPNREAFRKSVAQVVSAGGTAAVMLLDLNDFKDVNDTLGHRAGDLLLCEIGMRLDSLFGGSVARLGGDEFALLLTDLSPAEAQEAARALLESIAAPVLLQDVTLSVSASLGVVMLPRDGTDPDELLQHADVAMYNAKTARSGVEMYRTEDVRAVHRRVALAGDLPKAVHDHDFRLAYQLQADATTGRIVAAEALMRWAHPTYGAIPAPEVVALAERTGMLRHLTDAVLMDALEQRAAWSELGHVLTISVNVTARDLSDANLPALVEKVLRATGTPPSALTLEITESGVMKDPARCLRVLDALAAMSVQLSVDDFGTGYSSLAYLERLPVNEVKIDKSFVQRLERRASDSTVVRATIALAHDLGMRVVAEGIESQAAWARVADYGCELVQGYWIARPMPGTHVPTWLDNSDAGVASLVARRPKTPEVVVADQI